MLQIQLEQLLQKQAKEAKQKRNNISSDTLPLQIMA